MKKWIFIITSLLIITGCSNNKMALNIDGASQRVIFTDQALNKRLVVDDISTEPVDGRSRALVRLSSQYKNDLVIQYRFSWYDDNSLEVNNKLSAWKQFIISSFDTVTLSEMSINPAGTQFRVQIREVN